MRRIREEGGNALFYCFAGGQPKPGFSWSRKDKQPMSRRVFIKGKRLLIRGVKKEDEGTYLCTARNVYGSEISSGQLTVKGKTCLSFRVYKGVNSKETWRQRPWECQQENMVKKDIFPGFSPYSYVVLTRIKYSKR